MLEREEIVDLVEVPLQVAVLSLNPDHDIVDGDLSGETDGVLNV